MGRRASTSLLEVKHGNFSSIKQPRGSAPGSRAASPAASSGSAGPRASGSGASGVASPRRLSDGGPVKDVALSREAYSKARNILLKRSSRASSGSAEGEGSAAELGEEEGGFKRVGQALVSGMSQALFNRRTSAKNHNLIKSLMAAISKEKIFNKLNDLGVDESVTDTLGEMYQAMMDLLIENYEPLENALGELLDEAIGGSLDLEPWVLSLRTAVVGSLMEVLQKQTGERDPEMSKAQELLVTKVVEAAQGMASEVAYMMRMRGPRGSRQLSSAPNGLLEAAGNADGDPQSPRGTSAGSGTPGSHHIGALHGHGLRGHGLHGAGSKDGSSAGHAEASQHFKKTVRNMFMMNAIGGHGPRFHTDVRAEQRKHFDESDAAAARDAAAAERSAAVAERRRRKSHVEANGLGEALESLGHQDEDGLSLSSPSSSMSHKRTGASQPSPTSPHGASRSTAAQDAVAPNTPTDPREARGPPREVRAPSAPSSGSRGGSRQSYGLAPSSGSGLSISPETSPHQDGQISANPFGIDSTPSSPRVAGAKSDQDERPDTRPSRGSTGGAEMTVAKILSNQAETVRAPEPKTVAQSRSTRDEAADVAEAVEAGVDHALQADDLGDLAVGAKGDQRRDEGRKGSRRVSGSKPHASKHHASGHDIGSLCIGGLGRRGRTHRSGHAAPTGWLSLKDRRLRTGQALSGPKRGRSHRAPWGSGEISTDVDAEDEQGFNWETFRMRLLREGIKLKIPAEILHKKSLSHQDALLLERLNPQAAATWHGDMSPSALRKSNAKLTASLSRLLRNSSQKSIASGTSRASLDPNDSDLWSAAPVAPSCNTMLHAAWKSQDAVELEDVYQHRADPWDHEHQHSRIVPPLHLVPLVGSKSRKKGRAVRPVSGAGGKLPILPFRSTCFDPPMSDRLLPEILTFPYVTDDFMESVYSITLEHSRASWSDTNTLATTEPRKAKRGGREARSLRDFHKHFYAV